MSTMTEAEKLRYEAYLKTGIYFVTSIQPKLKKDKDGKLYLWYGGKHSTSSRSWGWYKKKADAIKAVEENHCDMFECGNRYAVIEKVPFGVLPEIEEVQWFVWQLDPRCVQLKSWNVPGEGYGSSKYVMCDKPEWSKGTINWAIG